MYRLPRNKLFFKFSCMTKRQHLHTVSYVEDIVEPEPGE